MRCPGFVALAAALLLAGAARPAGAEASHWELFKVDHASHSETGPGPGGGSADVRPRETGLSLACTELSEGKLVRDVAMGASWTAPPGRVRVGERWSPRFEAAVTRNFAAEDWANGLETRLSASVYLRDVHNLYHFRSGLEARLESGVGVEPKRDDRPLAFPDADRVLDLHDKPIEELPLPVASRDERVDLVEGEIYLVVQVDAYLRGGCATTSDSWRHYYRWVRGDEGTVKGDLAIAARHALGGAVAGLRFSVRNLGTGQATQLTTDEHGLAKGRFESEAGADRVRLRVETAEIVAATRYALALEPAAPSRAVGRRPLRANVGLEVEIPRETPSKRVEYALPLAKVGVLALRWSESASRWEPIRATVAVRDAGESRLQAGPEAFTERGGQPGLDLYVPGPEFLGTRRAGVLGYDPGQKVRDLKFLALPPRAGAPTLVTLHLCDLATRIARLRADVFDYFRPIVGEDAARRVARLQVRFDASRRTPAYLDGVLFLPPSLDLASDEGAETLMHEWGHHVAAVLAADPEIEDQLGGPHDVWTPASPELAWDEGRAHFYGVLLTRGLDLPRSAASFGPGSARGAVDAHDAAGDQVEGVVAAALVHLYTSAGYRRTKDVMADFQAACDHAVATRGHPPRTSREFFDAVGGLVAERERAGRMAPAEAEAWRRRLAAVRLEFEVSP